MDGPQSLARVIGWLCLVFFLAVPRVEADDGRNALGQKTILILNSYHLTFAWSEQVLDELTTALTEAGVDESKLIVRFFDSVRINDPEIQAHQNQLLFESLEAFRFDLIITQDDFALKVLSDVYAEHFEGTPVVFCGVSANHRFPPSMQSHVTGVWENSEENDPLGTILHIHPREREVHLLYGANPTALALADLIRKQSGKFPDVNFHWIDGRETTSAEAWDIVKGLPEDALLISLGWKFGHDRVPSTLHDQLSLHSPVPVYLTDDFKDRQRHGPHLMGISRADPSAHGRRTAQYALRVLRGTAPAELAADRETRRQLFLFNSSFVASGIELGRLPEDAILLEAEASFLARHRSLLLTLVATSLALVLGLAAGLWFARRRKRHQILRLKHEREQFRSLFQGIQDLILICRPDQRIVECNDRAVQRLGRPREQIVGQPVSVFEQGDPDQLELVLAEGVPLRVEKQAVSSVQYAGRPAEMHVYHDLTATLAHQKAIQEAADALAETNDQLQVALRFAEDAAKTAREANAAKSRFLANISHEVRTPLNAIIALTEFLIEEGVSDHTEQDLADLRASGIHLLSLLDTVLDLSKIEADELEIECVPFSLEEVCADCITITRPKMRKSPVELRFAPPASGLPRVLGDPGRLRQIILNLLDNARKFTAAGHVELKFLGREPKSDVLELEISITDTGIGIGGEALENVFEPFFQTDASTTRLNAGTGTGLTISRNLARLMGGQISLESELGRGSIFTLSLNLPVDKSRTPASIPSPKEASAEFPLESPPPETDSLRFLVVDDNALNRKLLSRFLRRITPDVTAVDSGNACLATLENETFDIVFMDVQMPGLDGLETTRRIRQENLLARDGSSPIPIVAVTAHAMKDDRERCLAAGMDDYLTKPVSLHALSRAIEQHAAHSPVGPALAAET